MQAEKTASSPETPTLKLYDIWNEKRDFDRDPVYEFVTLVPLPSAELAATPNFTSGKFKVGHGTTILSLDGQFMDSEAVYMLRPKRETTIALHKLEKAIEELKAAGLDTSGLEKAYASAKQSAAR